MSENTSIDPVAIAAGIHDEPIDPTTVEAARERVARTLGAGEAPARETIEGCADFARLIPAYLAGELPEARSLLVRDHTRSCVPCRRVLIAARAGDAAQEGAPRRAPARSSRVALRFAAAAAALLAVSAVWLAVRQRPASGEMARVTGADGAVLLPGGESTRPAAVGASLVSERVLRTGRGAHAVLALADGSRVEVGERSELSVSGRRDGLTVHLARGRVIVEAAKQRSGRHLAIATSDCEVTVVGTVFSVAHGTRGSRVSVLEGEVKVAANGKSEALHPGDQTSTAPGAEDVPIQSDVAWSERQEKYLGLLGEIETLRRDVARAFPAPAARHETRLLDVAPAGTVIYAALPNLSGELLPSYRMVLERLGQGGLLADRLAPFLSSPEARAHVEEALSLLGELGEKLGDEIVVAVPYLDAGPVFYAEARRPRELAEFLPGFVERVNAAAAKTGERVLSLGAAAVDGQGMVVVQEGDFLALAPGQRPLEAFRRSVAGTSLAGSAFHHDVEAAYRTGVYQLLAVDLASLVARGRPGAEGEAGKREALAELGVLDAETLIMTRSVNGETSTTRAELGFGHERRGIAAWLAEPAPMGSLDFISPDATLAAAAVVKEPSALVDDLFRLLRAQDPTFDGHLATVERELGVDLRNDVAASLGGDLAIAVDGPLLPKPSIEVIAEVDDAPRLQAALERIAARADARLRAEGRPGLALTSTSVSGRTFHALGPVGADPWLHFTYEDGYLVAAPARVLVERAIRTRASGASLRTSSDFRSRLPGDGPLDVSALVWQNLGPALKTATPPSLGYAWGAKDRVVFSATGSGGLMGLELPALLSMTGHRKPDA